MFETISASGTQIPAHRRFRSFATSVVGHLAVTAVLLIIPLMAMQAELPKVPTMMAFVAAAPAPPPPPPPPAPAATSAQAAKRVEELSTSEFAAPVEVPDEILPETGLAMGPTGGMAGGVEGGVPGGVAGGVLGGLPSEPPPPPPAEPEPAAPVRVGGAITPPALVSSVPPEYPELALMAQLQGTVILEATVDTQGRVEAVRVLRSVGLLDEAAIVAVKQWRYSPLTLNGLPTPFILTVTVAFELEG